MVVVFQEGHSFVLDFRDFGDLGEHGVLFDAVVGFEVAEQRLQDLSIGAELFVGRVCICGPRGDKGIQLPHPVSEVCMKP